MIKRNKKTLIASSIVTLLPTLFGLLGSRFLPEKIISHWGWNGEPDGMMSPLLLFTLVPVILLATHWLCIFLTAAVDKNVEQNRKVLRIVFWIMPLISLISCGTVFMSALGYTSFVHSGIYLILGTTFLLLGNYMPKIVRSRTVGIKIKWTLANEENWNATHRFCGKLYVATGVLCFLAIPTPMEALPFVMLAIVLFGTLPPIVYSYRFYRKQITEGTATEEDYANGYRELYKSPKSAKAITVVMSAALVVFLPILLFTGSIDISYDDTTLTVEATFEKDLELLFEEIDAVEYREEGVSGTRLVGFASPKLLLGTFQNDEFGTYTRYTYGGNPPCLVLTVDGKTIVIGTNDTQQLQELYEKISAEIAKS